MKKVVVFLVILFFSPYSLAQAQAEVRINEIKYSPPILSEENNNSYVFMVIFVLLLGIGGGTVYFIRRKKITPKPGDDFDILDK